jgi:serine phosphatase RsbU (regulator of sigma subunit)
VVAVVAAAIALLGLSCLLAAPTGAQATEPAAGSPFASSPRAPKPLLSVSVGSTPVVSVSGSGTSSSSSSSSSSSTSPLVSVSVLGSSSPETSSPGSSTQLVNVSVGGNTQVGVSVPSTPVAPAPHVPSPPTGGGGGGGGGGRGGGGGPILGAPPLRPPTGSAPAPSAPASGSAPAAAGKTSTGSAVSAPASGSAAASAPSSAGAGIVHGVVAGSSGGRSGTVATGTTPRRHRRSGKRATTARGATVPASAPRGGGDPPRGRPASSGSHARDTRPGASTSASNDNPLDRIGRHIPLPLPVPDWSKPIILALLLVAMWLGVRAYLAARRAARLEGQRAMLLADVGAMQAALVPAVPARLGGLAVSVAYRPAEGPAAGGDFYDLFVPAPGRVAIILGDVAGHGHEALTQATLTRYTLRAYLQAGLQPRAALALAGRVLADRSGEHYATVAAGVYDRRDATLTYALAGHPPPILRGGWETWEPITICSSAPLGCDIPTGRRQSTISLPEGAEVCFFSDGLIEARCSRSDEEEECELLGRDRLSELLAALGPRPMAEDLLTAVRATARATPDDMAACILAPQTPTRGAHVHVEELEANEWALSVGHVQRFLQACRLPAGEIARTIELATATAVACGTAVLRVERSPTGATATVSQPTLGAPRAMSAREEPQPADEPLLHALTTV